MKGRTVRIHRLKLTITADDAVGRLPCVDARMVTAWTRCLLPELLESPLDADIERLRLQFEHTTLNELAKHPTER